jgi:hypothetical protein
MTDREAFEAWYAAANWPDPRDWERAFRDKAWAGQVKDAWVIWQAAVKHEREACAKECDEMPQRLGIHCARAIRARSEG